MEIECTRLKVSEGIATLYQIKARGWHLHRVCTVSCDRGQLNQDEKWPLTFDFTKNNA